jgi:transcriptional regulator with XRE-family HTH domain
MPERSFGRTVRYRRTKLGLSQAKLGDLVGRSASTIRSWERDNSVPNDPKILAALAAILGVDEVHLFEKAGTELPGVESSPTVEEALATLNPESSYNPARPIFDLEPAVIDSGHLEDDSPVEADRDGPDDRDDPADAEDADLPPVVFPAPGPHGPLTQPDPISVSPVTELPAERSALSPSAEQFLLTTSTPSAHELSYIEDQSQRQMYRVRTMATVVAALALVIALIWAFNESLAALGEWWDQFFGNLRL